MARPLPQPVRTFRVGGSVRDELLGRAQADRDWVVVGATPETMIASGYRPVGRDFPVFLHPETNEEYAVARTERKHGTGYRGFEFFASPEVTLEQDLARRDLTINAMARDERGALVDPYGGRRDLEAGILRHVSPAFAEDPLRVLRVARFAARFGFAVAPETGAMMRAIVSSGELATLAAERVWQELARGLMEPRPARMLAVLRDCGALAALLPEVDALYGAPQPPGPRAEPDAGAHLALALDYAADRGFDLAVRYAVLGHDLGMGAAPRDARPGHAAGLQARSARLAERLSARLRVPVDCRDAARLVARHHVDVARAEELRPSALLDLLLAADALRRPVRLTVLRQACEADRNSRPGRAQDGDRPGEWIARALEVVRGVNAGAIARSVPAPKVERAIRDARLKALRAWRARAHGGLLLE